MQKISLIVSAGTLAFLMGSCSLLPWVNKSEETTKQTKPPASPSTSKSKTQDSERRVKTEKPKSGVEVSGLIPTTNPDRRREEIKQGRQDPFASIPVEPKVTKVAPPPKSERPSDPPDPPETGTAKQPLESPQPPSESPKPTISEPSIVDLARATVITGVIDMGELTQVIVKAPNEKFSRYVQPGQYVSNGKVLVKRIEGKNSPTPIVVLEEVGVGIEIYKRVGEGAAQMPSEKSETAALLMPNSLPEEANRFY